MSFLLNSKDVRTWWNPEKFPEASSSEDHAALTNAEMVANGILALSLGVICLMSPNFQGRSADRTQLGLNPASSPVLMVTYLLDKLCIHSEPVSSYEHSKNTNTYFMGLLRKFNDSVYIVVITVPST